MPAEPIFTHAVASFDPTESGVLLWTRTAEPTALAWVLARDPELVEVVAGGTCETTEEADGTAWVEAGGLEPGTTWFYAFRTEDGRQSPLGRTRTLPAAPVERLRLGLTCCADYTAAPLGVYRALAEREVDAVVHLGDYIYEAATSRNGRRTRNPDAAHDLAGYRARYAQVRADPDVLALHLRHPMLTIWDDHDVADNAWRTGAKAHDPEEHGPWDERLAAAAQARAEWLPQRWHDPADTVRTWRSVAVGDLAELVLLDTRIEGRDRHPGDDGALPADHPDRSLLGDEQRFWLDERLADVTRPWAIVVSGVVVNEMVLPVPGANRLPEDRLPNGYTLQDGEFVSDDGWDGYLAERDHLVRGLVDRADRGGQTVILSGDVHSSWAFEGPRDDEGRAVAVEAVVPAASSAAMGRANVPLLNRLLDAAARRMDHVVWANTADRGYAVLELTPEAAEVAWWVVDPYADDPTEASACVAVRRSRRDVWPCRFEPVDVASPGPIRPELATLPERPVDLRRLRAMRAVRLWGRPVVAATALGALPVLTRVRRVRS